VRSRSSRSWREAESGSKPRRVSQSENTTSSTTCYGLYRALGVGSLLYNLAVLVAALLAAIGYALAPPKR